MPWRSSPCLPSGCPGISGSSYRLLPESASAPAGHLRRQIQAPPRGRGVGLRWITSHEQQLQFTGLEHACGLRTVGPEQKAPARQTFMTKPETLRVVNEDFDRGARAVAKHKQSAGKRVSFSRCRQAPTNPSIPARKSIGSTATRICICGVIWIMSHSRTRCTDQPGFPKRDRSVQHASWRRAHSPVRQRNRTGVRVGS